MFTVKRAGHGGTYMRLQQKLAVPKVALNITKYQHNFARLRTLTQTH